MNIHEKITKYREQKGLSKSQLAREINVSPAYITMLENGTKTPSTDLIVRMAYTFNINPSQLDDNISTSKDYNELTELINKLSTSPEFKDDKELVESLKDRLLKDYMEGDSYKRSLFDFYKKLGELNDVPVYYDDLDKKIFFVGLDNFKKVLSEEDLIILFKILFLTITLKKFVKASCENNSKMMIDFFESSVFVQLNKLKPLNIPDNKKLVMKLSLMDNSDFENKIKENEKKLEKKLKQRNKIKKRK